MAAHWYLAYSLSYRNIEELMLERGIKVNHATVNGWVVKYAPLLEAEFRKKYKKQVGSSWRMDETYIKIKSEWYYLYRAVDKEGKIVDFYLSKTRDKTAAKRFFIKAIGCNGLPEKITIDKSGANKSALETINFILCTISLLCRSLLKILVCDIKYINNIVEQDHRFVKCIVNPMKGFKGFHSASASIAGVELYHMLRKGQHKNAANQLYLSNFMS